jgi:hypothetical protein
MYFADHPPPHFHAEYGEHRAVIDIESLTVIGGKLPPRALGLALEWATLHQAELREDWRALERDEPPRRIPPLD